MSDREILATTIDGEFIDWPRRPTTMAACSMFMFATVGVVAQPVLAWLVRLLWPGYAVYISPSLGVLCQVLAMLVPVLSYRAGHPGVDSSLRLKPPKGGQLLIAAACAVVGLFLADNLGTLWLVFVQLMGARISGPTALGGGVYSMVYAMFCLALLPAICEELLFRGAILGAFERRGTKHALALSTVLFALAHASVEALPVQLLLGFVMGYLVVNADSIYVSILYHFVHNAGVVALSTLGWSQLNTIRPGELLYLSIGGAAGVALLALRALILLAVLCVLLLAASSEREKSGRPFEREGPLDNAPMHWREQLVLMSGVVASSTLLLINVLKAMRLV